MERLTYLFKKYADKTCTQEEFAEFMAIVNEQKNHQQLDQLMDEAWKGDLSGLEMDRFRASQVFNRVMDANRQVDIPRKLLKLSFLIPAAAVLLIGMLVFLFQSKKISLPGKVAAIAGTNVQKVINNIAAQSEHRKIKLQDGSIVILNSESTLEFPEKFAKNSREVVLQGEGYFDIVHDPNRPFTVRTGKIKTTVLGTAFNIKAYERENNVIVTVTRGKVKVQDDIRLLGIIVPNQQIVFNKSLKKAELLQVEAKQAVEWQENDLFFEDVTMEEAAATLAKRFNVKIRFANAASKNCRFTATFLKGEQLTEILQVIGSFNNVSYKMNAGEVTISGEGCKQ